MFGFGAGELFLIFVIALVFIGPKRLPELARSLGKGIREFQKVKDDLMHHVHHPDEDLADQVSQSSQAEAVTEVEVEAEHIIETAELIELSEESDKKKSTEKA